MACNIVKQSISCTILPFNFDTYVFKILLAGKFYFAKSINAMYFLHVGSYSRSGQTCWLATGLGTKGGPFGIFAQVPTPTSAEIFYTSVQTAVPRWHTECRTTTI